ncbi:hypothetical protein ACJJTC_013468 [Scirpophaga incertulas]
MEPDQNVSHDSDRTRTLPTTPTLQAIIEESPSILTVEGNVNIVTDEIWNQPGSSHQPHVPRPPSPIQILLQDSELRTPRPPTRTYSATKRSSTYLDVTRATKTTVLRRSRADHFLNADLELRNFLKRAARG